MSVNLEADRQDEGGQDVYVVSSDSAGGYEYSMAILEVVKPEDRSGEGDWPDNRQRISFECKDGGDEESVTIDYSVEELRRAAYVFLKLAFELEAMNKETV